MSSRQSEYPTVDGPLSIQSYFTALDSCYRKYKQKFSRRRMDGSHGDAGISSSGDHAAGKFDLSSANAFVFHTPFSKLVQKSLGRLLYNDFSMEKVGELVRILGKIDIICFFLFRG